GGPGERRGRKSGPRAVSSFALLREWLRGGATDTLSLSGAGLARSMKYAGAAPCLPVGVAFFAGKSPTGDRAGRGFFCAPHSVLFGTRVKFFFFRLLAAPHP